MAMACVLRRYSDRLLPILFANCMQREIVRLEWRPLTGNDRDVGVGNYDVGRFPPSRMYHWSGPLPLAFLRMAHAICHAYIFISSSERGCLSPSPVSSPRRRRRERGAPLSRLIPAAAAAAVVVVGRVVCLTCRILVPVKSVLLLLKASPRPLLGRTPKQSVAAALAMAIGS